MTKKIEYSLLAWSRFSYTPKHVCSGNQRHSLFKCHQAVTNIKVFNMSTNMWFGSAIRKVIIWARY